MPSLLPAPIIEPKLPAQYFYEQQPLFIIPFSLNRAVSRNNFKSIALKIKTASTNTTFPEILFTKDIRENNNSYRAYFSISKEFAQQLEIGQFYKAQVAFVADNEKTEVGTYSEVGVFKFTARPILTILDPQKKELEGFGANPRSFTGKVVFDEDPSEKISHYEFNVYDENGELFDTSGDQIHDIDNDIPIYINGNSKDLGKVQIHATDPFVLKKDLDPMVNYYIIYTIRTINNLSISTHPYWIKETQTMTLEFPGELYIEENREDGYLSLRMKCLRSQLFSGSFKILRTDFRSNYQKWDPVSYIAFAEKCISENEDIELFQDFTVEQGVQYKYALQQYCKTENIYIYKKLFALALTPEGHKVPTDLFSLNFEDMFLTDGKQQLKVKFNPKVNSLKNNILENKIDTIGSQYPFFFRNGTVKYKEFQISGLISCHMDENCLFAEHKDIDTQLTYENIQAEREFKLKVLEWLSDGKPKLFRSSAEGNYIVRLMKVSLKPVDKLGRMLHSFSATAYEIMDYNFENLSKANILSESVRYFSDLKYETKLIEKEADIQEAVYANIRKHDNRTFGEEIILTFKNGRSTNISIGFTGSYYVDIEKDNPLVHIAIKDGNFMSSSLEADLGFIDKSYVDCILNENHEEITNFTTVSNIAQFIGCPIENPKNIIAEISQKTDNNDVSYLESVPYIRIQSKLILDVWERNGKLYDKENPEFAKIIDKYLRTVIYHDVAHGDNGKYYMYNINSQHLNPIDPSLLDYQYSIEYKGSDSNIYKNDFALENNYIELDLENLKKDLCGLYLGNALYADIAYYKTQYQIKR